MSSVQLAALLRLIFIAGGASFVNPYVSEDHIDLNQVWVEIPSTLVALGGDVHIHVHGVSGTGVRVRLAREDDDGRTLLATMPLALDAEDRMTLPCGYFSRGGTYYLELVADKDGYLPDDNTTELTKRAVDTKVKRDVSEGSVMETGDSVVKSWKFDVLWPSANLDVTPEQIQTYPERQVMAILEFPRVMCTPVETSADFWLELLYCGHSSGGAVLCDGKNTSSRAHVLYSEQMHGFPGRRTMTLRCELFGQAGDYALTLRPAAAAGPQDLATAFVKADWSEQFVLNVHGGSVFPCGDGVRVLFQYPECVLEGADRVRVFGRDADRLRYVAEMRVRRGQHTVSFDCRLFSERYPEYCFVYVSQAVTGAVADVRMDCLPTLPLSDGGAGGWGEWSPWSACPAPARCSTRTRSRHRFCDSPPPAYGAKYCEMAPKKEKGKKEDEKTGTFNEVEKTFLELQIAECNRKIARLRSAVESYEMRNDELQKAYDKLDEDRADIIAYLKKTLTEKNDENSELKEKVKGLEEIRQIENAEFHKTVSELENNFTVMKDQLTSENKLLAGKLNTLEEFRAIRDDLMKKFEKQEEDFKEQEMSYKRIIYNTEKKYVVAKDKLKKEMEARLLQLAQDFQDATELRIAASTQRVIRENIAVTNEINDMLITQNKLAEQNKLFKEKFKAANMSKEMAEEERDKAINKNVVHLKLIDQLTSAFENLKKEKGIFEKKSFDLESLQYKLQKITKENDNLMLQVRILEQNLHSKLSDQNKSTIELTKVSKECEKVKNILKEAAIAIQAALKLDQWAVDDPAREVVDRQLLLSQLLEIVSQYREIQETVSLSTINSFSKVYQEGDLGFIPKSFIKKKMSGQSTGIVSEQSQKQEEIARDESKKTVISSSVSTSLGESSIKTIPSIHILPPGKLLNEPKVTISLESLASSTKPLSEEQDKESVEEKSSKDRKLLAIKLEIQKSIMKDLAFSEMSFIKSQMASLSKASISSFPKKSAMQNIGSKQFLTVPSEKLEKEEIKQVEDLTIDDDRKEVELTESSEGTSVTNIEKAETNVLDRTKDESAETQSTDEKMLSEDEQ